MQEPVKPLDKPVVVTDATFAKEVLQSDLPVIVDSGHRGADLVE